MSPNGKAGPAPAGGWLDGEQQRAWLAYIRVQLRLAYEMNRQLLAESGLSLPDYDVLTGLSVADGGRMQITVLAAQIGWERSRVSHHVRRMSARGLVTCGLSAADRRVTEVTLTAQGRQALEDAAPGHVDLVRRLFFDGLRAAWRDRSARHWKACTPTSSNRARSRRRSTGTRQATERARPLLIPSRGGGNRRAGRHLPPRHRPPVANYAMCHYDYVICHGYWRTAPVTGTKPPRSRYQKGTAMPNAIVMTGYGPPEVLKWAGVPLTEPGEGQIRIKVKAAGISPTDLALRAGYLKDIPLPRTRCLASRQQAPSTRSGPA
jgi:DNA-binding MarR family transcriptional regulator